MNYLLVVVLTAFAVQVVVGPPVNQDKKDDQENKVDDKEEMADVMEYHRYLKEVVQALESDPDFRAKLEKAQEVDIRSGKIAHELEFVNHKVRTKLDELKREELERLRHLANQENILNNGLDLDHLKIAEHLDHRNSRTFEINDLKKLIAKTSKDLAEADRRRREEFKQYEMQKKFEEEQKLKGNTGMNEEERKKYEEKLHEMKEKHKKHQPLHHPGSKQQLEEVWEKQDHMESQDFDPRTFFYLHDVDGNGFWDQNEVKALFVRELDKLYAEGALEGDLMERFEEMERMREHVFAEADLNKDGLISYDEFLQQTKRPDFQQDQGWEGLDEQQIYSQQEYEAFEKRRQEEIQRMIAKGLLSPHPDNIPVQHEQFPPQYGQAKGVPPNQVPPQQQQQQFHGQLPPQHVPQHQYPDQQYHVPSIHDQVPLQHGQIPQQPYQGQVPQQQFQGQVPPNPQYQQQQYQNQQPQQYQSQQPLQQQAPQQAQQHVQNQQPNNQGQMPPQQVQQQSAHSNVVPPQNTQNVASSQQQQPKQPEQPQQQTGQLHVQQQIQHNALPSVGKV